jgi:hopene-associated glycosyltransferase HpnB
MLVLLAGLALAVWVWLALLRGGFWQTDQRLPDAPDPVEWPSVAVVVPARDEADMLPATLPTLVGQDYPGAVRIILVDDGSTDGTGEVAARFSPAVTVVRPGPPPPGWTGKLWALAAGVDHAVAHAEQERETANAPELLLFTDADVAHRPDSLSALVRAAVGYRLDLVSQMAKLRARTGWERIVVPAFVYFFALLYPFRWSNKAGAHTAAAAGGCSLVRRAALAAVGGVAAIRFEVIDDVALARTLKRAGSHIYLGLADRVDSVRPYPTLASLWRMVARSAYAQLRHSVLLLAGTVFGLALVFLVPPVTTVVGAVTGDLTAPVLGGLAWLVMAGTYGPMLRYYGQPRLAALLLPFTATLYLAMTVDSAIQHYRGRGAAWKGRTYPARRSK